MIFINDLLSRVQKSDRSDVLARVYFVSSLVFFVCPVFYIFFWKIPDKVLPEMEENQVVQQLLGWCSAEESLWPVL